MSASQREWRVDQAMRVNLPKWREPYQHIAESAEHASDLRHQHIIASIYMALLISQKADTTTYEPISANPRFEPYLQDAIIQVKAQLDAFAGEAVGSTGRVSKQAVRVTRLEATLQRLLVDSMGYQALDERVSAGYVLAVYIPGLQIKSPKQRVPAPYEYGKTCLITMPSLPDHYRNVLRQGILKVRAPYPQQLRKVDGLLPDDQELRLVLTELAKLRRNV